MNDAATNRAPAALGTAAADTAPPPDAGQLLRVRGLVKRFPVQRGLFGRAGGWVHAVDDVSFDLGRGKTLSLVGESGCGKTTVGRSILRLIEPDAGHVHFDGIDILGLDRRGLRAVRTRMQIIFQDPYSSLNPRLSVQDIIGEGLRVHGLARGSELADRVESVARRVGLDAEALSRYPHEFSGGQRQRIGIARAVVLEPDFVVCDEAVSALDVSIQAQIINLLRDLQDDMGMSYLFIAHDLSVVRHISDWVAVMYVGEIVEEGPAAALFAQPMHPYSQALLAAAPRPDPRRRRDRIVLEGDVPSPVNPPEGCRFYDRGCPKRMDVCRISTPELLACGSEGHRCACYAVHGVPGEGEGKRRETDTNGHERT
ncbi:MAG: ATP-binding cassette domain-containing protein [Lentisphaeria bacterium]|nr:ATP-binding cassette domain-containing protein [Lentisphaeria bacterium]